MNGFNFVKIENSFEKVAFLLVRFPMHPTSRARGMHNKENEQYYSKRFKY